MKAAVLHQYDEMLSSNEFVQYEDVPDPKIQSPTDVIVRIGGAGVCRTDLHVVEGIWRHQVEVKLPYIMGHENAGWIEAVGSAVTGVEVGDAVICHPLVTSGHCLACRRGIDTHAEESSFPGINADGVYAEYLLTGQRSLIKLPKSLAPKDVAPYADAGLTTYRAAKKASRHLLPGEYAVVIGAGGLGHIGIQVLAALCAAEIIVIDRTDATLAKECGAHHTVKADGNEVEQMLERTKDKGAKAVIDFVGEGDAVSKGLAMTRNAGSYYIVGYGGKIEIPSIDMVTPVLRNIFNTTGTSEVKVGVASAVPAVLASPRRVQTSIQLDPGRFDHQSPSLGFRARHLEELLRGAGHRIHADVGKALLNGSSTKGLVEVAIEFRNHVGG